VPSVRGEARHRRLDRLARSVALIASLPESKVDFVAVDMPLANRFTIHILAAVAEYEARLISERSRAAMAADKARGRQFGNPDPRTHRFSPAARKAGVRAIREKAKARALNCLPLLCELRDRGETIHGIALELSALGIETPRRQMIWRDRWSRESLNTPGSESGGRGQAAEQGKSGFHSVWICKRSLRTQPRTSSRRFKRNVVRSRASLHPCDL
jgi:hypothetical protein